MFISIHFYLPCLVLYSGLKSVRLELLTSIFYRQGHYSTEGSNFYPSYDNEPRINMKNLLNRVHSLLNEDFNGVQIHFYTGAILYFYYGYVALVLAYVYINIYQFYSNAMIQFLNGCKQRYILI